MSARYSGRRSSALTSASAVNTATTSALELLIPAAGARSLARAGRVVAALGGRHAQPRPQRRPRPIEQIAQSRTWTPASLLVTDRLGPTRPQAWQESHQPQSAPHE